MSFFKDLRPGRVIKDSREYFGGEQRYKFRFLVISLGATLFIFTAFFYESGFEAEYQRPEIYWVESLSPDRTDEEIRTGNLLRQINKEIAEKRYAKKELELREQYKRAADQFGIEHE